MEIIGTKKLINVFVAIPSKEYWYKKFGMSLVSLVAHFGFNRVPGYDGGDIVVYDHDDSLLPRSRQRLVELAIEHEATHILFLDTDQSFPPNTLNRLAKWQKPVVACNICTKNPDKPAPTARAEGSKRYGRLQYVVPDEEGLVPTWRVGTGIMLIDLSVFRGLEKPWFNVTWLPEYNDFEGEDWYFMRLMERKGIPVYWDNSLSWEVGHWGPVCFQHQLIDVPESYKFEGQSIKPRVLTDIKTPDLLVTTR